MTFVEIDALIATVVKSVAALANTVERTRVINTNTARTTNVELLITLLRKPLNTRIKITNSHLVSIDAGIVALLVANWALAFV